MTVDRPFERVESRVPRLDSSLTESLVTPALLVDLAAARRNAERVLALCGDSAHWRPHLKTTKIPEVWAVLLDVGVRSFKVATTRELEVLAELGRRRGAQPIDVLFAQGLTPPSARRLGEIAAVNPWLTVAGLYEDERQLEWTPETVGLFLDVNPGGDRTGVPIGRTERLVELARAAADRRRGLHCYEGHLHGDFPERGVAIDTVFRELGELVAELDRVGLAAGEVVTSGTPAFRHVVDTRPLEGRPGVTRHSVSPGTVVFHDLRSELENPELGLEPAATVLARVVSRPAIGRVTVDAGSKAIAAEAGDPVAVTLGHPDLKAAPCNEEHLPLDGVEADSSLVLGALIELVPRHICPSVNLHEHALLLETADSGRPRRVPVAARAHE